MTSPSIRWSIVVLSLSLAVTGCGDDDAPPPGDGGGGGDDGGGGTDDGGGDEDAGSTTDDGGGTTDDGGGGADDGGGGRACEGFPTDFERGCGADANCVVGLHQIDCCGTLFATGINHSERDRFDTAEATCRASYPACGCAAGAT